MHLGFRAFCTLHPLFTVTIDHILPTPHVPPQSHPDCVHQQFLPVLLTVSYTPVHPLAPLSSANPDKSVATLETLITRRPLRLSSSSSSLFSVSLRRFNVLYTSSPCLEMHPRCIRESTPLCTRAHIRTLARPRPGLLPLLVEKSVSLPRPGRRSVDTTTTTLARRPRSTLSHPGIFVAHSRLRPCCRNALHERRRHDESARILVAARARRFRSYQSR